MKQLAILPLFCFLAIGCANQQTLERRVNSAVTLYVGFGGDKTTERAVRVTEAANIVKAVAGPSLEEPGTGNPSEQLRSAVIGYINVKYSDDPAKRNQYIAIATILLNELEISLVLPEDVVPNVLTEVRRLAGVVADSAIAAAKPFLKEPT